MDGWLSAAEASRLLVQDIENVCRALLPGGEKRQNEWCAADIHGGKGNSLKVHLTGERAGLWSDFSMDGVGGDALDLVKAVKGLNTTEAIQWVADRYGVSDGDRKSNGGGRAKSKRSRPAGPLSDPPPTLSKLGRWTDSWEYTDAKGQSLMWVCRFLDPDDDDPFAKTFRPWNGHEWKDPKGKLPLYGLAELAAHPDKPVLVVEGEKTADHARDLLPDYAVVTWPHGSKAAHKADWTPLRLRDCTFWPDADSAGKAAMEKAASQALKAGAFAARLVPLPDGLKKGWDLADPLPEGWDEEKIDGLITAARPVMRDQGSIAATISKAGIPGTIDLAGWQGRSIPERPWIVHQLIPGRNVTMLSGDGGLGKTLLILQLMVACALGVDWLGRACRRCRSLALLCEDDEEEIVRRLEEIAEHYGTSFAELSQHIRLCTRVGLENSLMTFPGNYGEGEATELHAQIMNQALQFGAQLVVVDSLHDAFTGNEINRVQARQFVNHLRHIAMETDGGVVLNAHPSQSGRASGSGEAGSTAWHNTVRSRLYLTAPQSEDGSEDDERRVLSSKKANYAKRGQSINLRWDRGVFVVDEKTGIEKRVHENKADEVFLAGLGVLTTHNIRASYARSSPHYAPRAMVRQKLNGKFPEKELAAAMERLIADGAIRNDPYGKPSDRTFNLVVVDPPKNGSSDNFFGGET